MSVYLLIDIQKINEPETYARYIQKARTIIERHGGRYLVRGGQATTISGHWAPERIVVIEFESLEKVQACFQSQQYRQIAPLRKQSIVSRAIVVEGHQG